MGFGDSTLESGNTCRMQSTLSLQTGGGPGGGSQTAMSQLENGQLPGGSAGLLTPVPSPSLLWAATQGLGCCRHTLASAAPASQHFPGRARGHTHMHLCQRQAGVRAWGGRRLSQRRSLAGEGEGKWGRPPPAHPVERLRQLPQEVLGHLDSLIHGQVEVGVCEVLLDPAGQLPPLVSPGKPLPGGGQERKGKRRDPGAGARATLPSTAPLDHDWGSCRVGGAPEPAPCPRRS